MKICYYKIKIDLYVYVDFFNTIFLIKIVYKYADWCESSSRMIERDYQVHLIWVISREAARNYIRARAIMHGDEKSAMELECACELAMSIMVISLRYGCLYLCLLYTYHFYIVRTNTFFIHISFLSDKLLNYHITFHFFYPYYYIFHSTSTFTN